MRYERVPIKFLRKKCPQHYFPVNDNVESTGKFDYYLQRTALLSQLGLLVLGTVGYFYTILPVFQHQLLQEQAANLEIEKHAAQKQLASLLKQQSTVKEDIQLLREKLEKEQTNNDLLTKTMSDLKVQKIDAENYAKNAEEKLRHDILKLEDSTRWKSFFSDFLQAYNSLDSVCCRSNGHRTEFETTEFVNTDGLRADQSGAFILEEEKYWPNPHEILLKAIIVENKKRQNYPKTYYDEMRAFVNKNESALECKKPNFNKIHAEFIAKLVASDAIISAKLDSHHNDLAIEQNPKLREKLLSIHRESIREKKLFQLKYLYLDKLGELRGICDDKVSNFFKGIINNKVMN
jgi:hypothetical protein